MTGDDILPKSTIDGFWDKFGEPLSLPNVLGLGLDADRGK